MHFHNRYESTVTNKVLQSDSELESLLNILLDRFHF